MNNSTFKFHLLCFSLMNLFWNSPFHFILKGEGLVCNCSHPNGCDDWPWAVIEFDFVSNCSQFVDYFLQRKNIALKCLLRPPDHCIDQGWCIHLWQGWSFKRLSKFCGDLELAVNTFQFGGVRSKEKQLQLENCHCLDIWLSKKQEIVPDLELMHQCDAGRPTGGGTRGYPGTHNFTNN